jgi:hypothetical protein
LKPIETPLAPIGGEGRVRGISPAIAISITGKICSGLSVYEFPAIREFIREKNNRE